MIPKVRYFNKLTKEMVTSDFVVSSQGRVIDTYNNNGWVDMEDTVILMQSTGLFDKNGVEIFEGDVVRTGNGTYQVIFGQQRFRNFTGIGLYLIKDYGEFITKEQLMLDEGKYEVISNIHEHPELVEVGHDQ